jgi:hypothetical protein
MSGRREFAWVNGYRSGPMRMSGSTSSGNAPNDKKDVMGQEETSAPQRTAPLFDLQTSDVARSHASSAGIGCR